MFNLSLLNSGIILFALAGILPILIYLFAKKKPQKIIFSSIKFIKESTQQKKQKMNLKNLLLLIIRILIIVLTILAIARPALKVDWLQSSNKHPKTAIAIIVDNSYSMDFLIDTKTSLDQAKSNVNRINDKLSSDDITLLLSLDESWNQIYGTLNYGKLDKSVINNMEITAKPLDINKVYKLAEQKLEESNILNREIIIISDNQDINLPIKTDINTFYIPVHDEKGLHNISIQNSEFTYNLINRKLQNNLNFDLVNHSNNEQNDIICRLFLDGNSVAEKVVDLKPKQTKLEIFQFDFDSKAWHTGFVEVINERLTYDNKNYFAFYHDPNPKLAIISDLDILPRTLSSIAEIYDPNYKILHTMDFDELNTYDAIICYKYKKLDRKDQYILNKLASKQGITYIADPELSPEWKEYLAKSFDVTFHDFVNKPQNSAKISSIQKFHPITKDIKLQSNTTLNDFWKISATRNILLQSDESPVIIFNRYSLFWNFDVASNKSEFYVDPAFPIIAYNSLLNNQAKEQIIKYDTGYTIEMDSSLILPSGKTISAKSYRFDKAGIYQLGVEYFAVNNLFSESDFIKQQYSGEIKILETDSWEKFIISSRYGFELWKILLAIVLLLFILEIVLIKRSESKAN